uniref:Uncharacterized protein n=1 Tax=Arundo donax TaxID=35708 RepID=A0A0A9EVP7_ARUDO
MHFGDYLNTKFIIIHQLLKDCLAARPQSLPSQK